MSPTLGFIDQSHPNSFTNLKIYIVARFVYIKLGPKPPQSAVISCGVMATEPFTFPQKLPRLTGPQGHPAVPRGSEYPGEGLEGRPKRPRQEGRTAGAGSTRTSVHDPVIPRKNGTFCSFRQQRGGGENPSISSGRDDADAATRIRDAGNRVTGIAAARRASPSPSGSR